MYTFATKKWEQLLLGKNMDYPTWSRSGEYVHFFDLVEDGTPFYRVRVSGAVDHDCHSAWCSAVIERATDLWGKRA